MFVPTHLSLHKPNDRTTQTHTQNHITMHRAKKNKQKKQQLIHSMWTDRPPVSFTAFPSSTLQSQPEDRKRMCCVFLDVRPGSNAPEEDQ